MMDDEKRIDGLIEENERLRKMLEDTREVFSVDPDKVYVIEVERGLTVERAELIRDMWRESTGSKCIILSGGAHVARVRTSL